MQIWRMRYTDVLLDTDLKPMIEFNVNEGNGKGKLSLVQVCDSKSDDTVSMVTYFQKCPVVTQEKLTMGAWKQLVMNMGTL